jgi:hypothetical protein
MPYFQASRQAMLVSPTKIPGSAIAPSHCPRRSSAWSQLT